MSRDSVLINISPAELSKCPAKDKILAVVHSTKGQRHGAKKIPSIGMEAFTSIREQLVELIKSNIVISSTGGGTGNGITTKIFEHLAAVDNVEEDDKTCFILVLPDGNKEPFEFVQNTIDFISMPLSSGIDSGNTGNIFLVSNNEKYSTRCTELDFNQRICSSFHQFFEIPKKCELLEQVEGYIDTEDFLAYLAKPYFNYFATFPYSADKPLEQQLHENKNPLLLPPSSPIEALFMLELPPNADSRIFYPILDHFEHLGMIPLCAVVMNQSLHQPLLTVSVLYSRKPQELIDDFNRLYQARAKTKIKKSIEQHVVISKRKINIEEEAKKAAHDIGKKDEDILALLRRLGKL